MEMKMKTNNDGPKMMEFGKLDIGGKFYLSNPSNLTENAAYTKMATQKGIDGKWSNAKNALGLVTFVQYDKRIWKK
jgi:hypothetical protein